MYILPEKVSGFYDEGDTPPETLPFSVFQGACERIERESEYSIVATIDYPSQSNRSYYLSVLQHFVKGHFLLFCNRYYPLVAFSKLVQEDPPDIPAVEAGIIPPNEFINLPELHPLFGKEFTMLSKEYLATSVNADNPKEAISVSQLSFTEFAEFSYWKPKVISDIIFNNWGD